MSTHSRNTGSSTSGPRVLFAAHACYLDDSNDAVVASRAMMESLVRSGFAVEALSGMALDIHQAVDPDRWLADRGIAFEGGGGSSWSADVRENRSDAPPHFRLIVGGVPVTIHRGIAVGSPAADGAERQEFLTLYEAVLNGFRPDVVVSPGGDLLAREVRRLARERGIAVVFALHHLHSDIADLFSMAAAVIVPSRYLADRCRRVLKLDCTVLPYLIDFDRVRAATRDARYVTFVNPSHEHGVYVFARIADELGRRRPDIPLLIVEGLGSDRTLAECGIDPRALGNVHLMSNTPDPRTFWGVTRVCLVPSLGQESQGLVAVEAMINGIPVVASDRGALPETLGVAGVVLPLAERLTPSTRELPSAEEAAGWVETIVRIWDDPEECQELSRRSLAEAGRWDPAVLEPLYATFFHEVRVPQRPRHGPQRPASAVASSDKALKSRDELGAYLNRRNLLGVGAEVGVQNGFFARQVLDQWDGQILYLIDIWQQLPGYEDLANVPAGEQVKRLIRTVAQVSPHWPRVRLIQELSVNAARLIPDGSLDWVYIDANHEYSSVLKDLAAWVPKVREGGIVAGHDFLDGVIFISGVKTVFGVKRAVQDFFEGRGVNTTEEEFPTWFVTKTLKSDSASTRIRKPFNFSILPNRHP